MNLNGIGTIDVRMIRILAVVITAACGTSTEVERPVEVSTAGRLHRAPAAIEARIVNRSDATVHVSHCDFRVSIGIERRSGDGWVHYRQSNGPLCLGIHPSGELPIGPGRELIETLQIDEAGEFRLRVYVRRAHEDFGSLVATSPPVTVLPAD